MKRGFGQKIPEGIPLNVKLLPEYLEQLGYESHMFGKWHLGHCNTKYTPTARGFNSMEGKYVAYEKGAKVDIEKRIQNILKELKDQIKRQELGSKKIKGSTKFKPNKYRFSNKEKRKELKNILLYKRKQLRRQKIERKIFRNHKVKIRGKRSLREFDINLIRPKIIQSNYYAKKVNNFLRDHQGKGSPFFLYLSFFTKTYTFFGEDNSESRNDQIQKMDSAVGEIVSSLKKYNYYNNTILMFISDNGAHQFRNLEKSHNFPLR